MITARILLASALLAGVSWGVWKVLDDLLGGSLRGADRQRRRRRGWRGCRVHARRAGDARARGPPGQPPDPRAARAGLSPRPRPMTSRGRVSQRPTRLAPEHRSPLTTYVPGLCVLPGRRDTPDTWTGRRPEGRRVAAAGSRRLPSSWRSAGPLRLARPGAAGRSLRRRLKGRGRLRRYGLAIRSGRDPNARHDARAPRRG